MVAGLDDDGTDVAIDDFLADHNRSNHGWDALVNLLTDVAIEGRHFRELCYRRGNLIFY